MLNERRVKHMVKLASYESKNGAEDMKINSYFKKDYVSFQVLCSLIWMTIGYLLIVGLAGIAYMDTILDNFTLKSAIMIVAVVLGVYIILFVIYWIASARYYNKKHVQARHHMKYHIQGLEILENMYAKEEQ